MTLADLIAAHPDLFYGQTWYEGEGFMEVEASDWVDDVPEGVDPPVVPLTVEVTDRPAVSAMDLATLYVRNPHHPVWDRFLWTDDVDRYGNRVYVAGLGRYGCEGFQIHRHLTPEAYFVRLPG